MSNLAHLPPPGTIRLQFEPMVPGNRNPARVRTAPAPPPGGGGARRPSIAPLILAAYKSLVSDHREMRFAAPVAHVYQPLEYAWPAFAAYVERYARPNVDAVWLGMNPGPFGMAQTGVPFGEVAAVRDWLGICAPVTPPKHQHPRRPILGFDCPRSEVSGRRVWGLAKDCYATPEAFFSQHFILNYCPLAFVEAGGANRTPDKLPAGEREPLFAACDHALLTVIRLIRPRWLIAVGGFAESCARRVLADEPIQFARIPHPSPANPAANRDWAGAARAALAQLGLCPRA
jgi:single-strand selective monofunctional uracil DNA glycosylase